MKKCIIVLLIVAFVFPITACAPARPQVGRLDPDQDYDLTGEWSSDDSRRVAHTMVDDCLSPERHWLRRFKADNEERPRVIVGLFRNLSSIHVDREMFTQDIARELINSGEVSFVADDEYREALREEREQQEEWATEATTAAQTQELGADFMLQGTFQADRQRWEGEQVVTYQVDMELVDLETTERVWIGTERIRKLIQQSRYSW